MNFHKLEPVCLSPEIQELYLPSWNTISPPFLVFRQLHIDIFYIYIYKKTAEQKPKAPVRYSRTAIPSALDRKSVV